MIQNKKIVITGASSGIGRSLLEKLAAEPSNVIIAACRSTHKITGFGKNVIPVKCDLSTKEGIDTLFEAIFNTFSLVDIFIANAGAPYYEKYDYVDYARTQSIFNLNAVGNMYLYTKYLEHLRGREGHLVYTISAMGEMALPGYALYTSTKFAMKGFQQAIRLEKPKTLKLTCVYPVSTDTNFFRVGGNGVKVEKPFPVQSAGAVADKMIKAIEKNRKQLYPCPVYLPSKILMTICPPVRAIYWRIEKGRLDRFLKRQKKEGR